MKDPWPDLLQPRLVLDDHLASKWVDSSVNFVRSRRIVTRRSLVRLLKSLFNKVPAPMICETLVFDASKMFLVGEVSHRS
jgi:hypothetical protein